MSMFSLGGNKSISDIPTAFPEGKSEHEMTIIKSEIKVPARPSNNVPAEIEPYRRNLQLTFSVDDSYSNYFELSAQKNVSVYALPETVDYDELSAESRKKIREALNFYKTTLYDLGYSDAEIEAGVSPEDLIGIMVNATVTKGEYTNITGHKIREKVIED